MESVEMNIVSGYSGFKRRTDKLNVNTTRFLFCEFII